MPGLAEDRGSTPRPDIFFKSLHVLNKPRFLIMSRECCTADATCSWPQWRLPAHDFDRLRKTCIDENSQARSLTLRLNYPRSDRACDKAYLPLLCERIRGGPGQISLNVYSFGKRLWYVSLLPMTMFSEDLSLHAKEARDERHQLVSSATALCSADTVLIVSAK